jgi:hypothetical protein
MEAHLDSLVLGLARRFGEYDQFCCLRSTPFRHVRRKQPHRTHVLESEHPTPSRKRLYRPRYER